MERKDFLQGGIITALSCLVPMQKQCAFFLPDPKFIKPKHLAKNATIGLVAPASPIYNDVEFERMLTNLKNLGYNLVLGKHVRDKRGYLAGKDEDRAADLNAMFLNPEIDAILCIRGGWGSNRILPLIDFNLIKNNPKIFVGFSDITSLHLAIQAKTGLVTFHGPVGKSEWNSFTLKAWNAVLQQGQAPEFRIPETETDWYTINPGVAKGRLLGGNLTVLTSLIGSNYLPDFDGAILFLEDVGEDAYRIDRMLTQLRLSGMLEKLNGFVFGKCTKCSDSGNSLSLKQVFEDHLHELKIPAFYGAMISHEEQNITLPVGVQALINADTGTIKLLEPGVLQ